MKNEASPVQETNENRNGTPAAAIVLYEALRAAAEGDIRPLLRLGRFTDLVSPSQGKVMLETWKGATNKQIAYELGISPRTVETHRVKGMKKVNDEQKPKLNSSQLLWTILMLSVEMKTDKIQPSLEIRDEESREASVSSVQPS